VPRQTDAVGGRARGVVDLHRPAAWRFWWRAAGIFGAACFLFWWLRIREAGGDRVQLFANFDVLMYWLPLLREAAAQWRAGAVPLWNPYQALGTPLLATQQVAALYPFNALYLLLASGTAWWITALAHQWIAALGLYALCRTLGLSAPAAVLGGISYAFSAVLIAKCIYLPDELICVAWLPWMFAAAERVVNRPAVSTTVALAAVCSLHILGGDADTIARASELLGAYVVLRLVTQPCNASERRRAATALGAAAMLALLLTAVQWLPTLELVRHSVRDLGRMTAAQQAGFALNLEELFLTRVRGVAVLSISSSLPLVLALVGWVLWSRRAVAWFFGAAAMVIVALALGPATPLYGWFRYLPSGTWFRVPLRFMNLWPMCVAPLAAAGAEALLIAASRQQWRRVVRVGIGSALIVLAIKAGFALRNEAARVWLVLVVFDALPLILVAGLAKAAHRGALRLSGRVGTALATFCIFAVPVVLFQPDSLPPQRVADLYAPYADLFAQLRNERPARVLSLLPVADGRMWAKLGSYFEVPVLNDFEPLSLMDFRDFAAALRGPEPASVESMLDVFTGDVAPPHPHFDSRLLNLSGVRFVVVEPGKTANLAQWFAPGVSLVPWRESRTAVVYENRTALPRAFFVLASGLSVSRSGCVDTLLREDFDPMTQLIVEQPMNVAVGATAAAGSVRIVEYTPGRISMDITAGGDGFVLLTDAFYPGWVGRSDGSTPAAIVRADCFFRAVPVSAGRHEVVLEYTPRSFRLGAAVSIAAIGLTAVVLAVSRVNRRRAVRRSLKGKPPAGSPAQQPVGLEGTQ
jgi:hypothetical protein